MPSPETQSAHENQVDVGILTVISPELDAALEALAPMSREKDEKTGTVFWRGTVRSQLKNCEYQVVLSCIGEPGNPTAAAAATELLMKYEPRALFLMGIATARVRGRLSSASCGTS